MKQDGTTIQITPEMRRTYARLADMMMCAYLADMGGITFSTATQRFGTKATRKPPGDYWILSALRTSQEMLEIRDNYNEAGHAAVRKGQAPKMRIIRPRPEKS